MNWYEEPIDGRDTGQWSPDLPGEGYADRHYWPDVDTQRAELGELARIARLRRDWRRLMGSGILWVNSSGLDAKATRMVE